MALASPMLDPRLLTGTFVSALPYPAYVATGTPEQRESWGKIESRVALTAGQLGTVRGFTRRVNVLVVSGIWCGDCVAQCPMLYRIEQANPGSVTVRFVDRDQHLALAEQVRICGGLRVPTAIFMNEEMEFVSLLGDRTLARYRAIAAKKLGAMCPLPGARVPEEELAATLQDWVDEFERVHLLVRLSPKLRQKHGD